MNFKPDQNIEIFLAAQRSLLTLIECVQLGLSVETWKMLFNGVILPMLDDFIFYSENPGKLPAQVRVNYERIAALFCSKMAEILSQPPQNF